MTAAYSALRGVCSSISQYGNRGKELRQGGGGTAVGLKVCGMLHLAAAAVCSCSCVPVQQLGCASAECKASNTIQLEAAGKP